MQSKSRSALMLFLPLLLGMRDPFLPVDDPVESRSSASYGTRAVWIAGNDRLHFARRKRKVATNTARRPGHVWLAYHGNHSGKSDDGDGRSLRAVAVANH